MSGRPSANYLILAFFFLTGLTGLAYELVWIRLLILAFGSTQFAVTTVLVVFMAGLALGSLIFGRIADRTSSPLKLYAMIEVALGVYCVLSPAIFSAIKGAYLGLGGHAAAASTGVSATFEAPQFALSFLALIIPTTLMGGTLPALVKYLASGSGRIGFHTAVPYSVNTLGAVAGCLLTGFFSLYVLGVKTTVYTAGVIDIIVGVLVYMLYGRSVSVPVEPRVGDPAQTEKADSGKRLLIIASFALSGFASLNYEVLWSRLLSLVLGSSVYAFTIMLATFLVGIGLGSIVFAPFIDRKKNLIAWFALFEAVIGVVSLVSIFVYRELPFVFYSLKESFASQFWLFMFIQFLLTAAIMIIPTLCMGAIFPLVGRLAARDLKSVGKSIGDIYFFNTAGSIFGAFIGGFVLIPYAGVQNGVILTAALNLVLAIALFTNSELKAVKRLSYSVVLVVIFAASYLALPPWEKMVMTLGLYANPVKESKVSKIRQGSFGEDLLYYKEGINAIVTVRGEAGGKVISYQANGKQEARSVEGRPSEAWSLLGHVPLLLHPGEPKDALVVGLGSGITLGAMELYPLEAFDVVELEPAVVDAARFFNESNNNALDDKRVSLHVTDGRSFLALADKKYDVIVSGVSDPWITGVSNLFTYEYFKELDSKLEDDGIVGLWFQNYRITPKELKIALGSFARVFPHVSIWFHYTDTLDLIVVGSKTPHGFDLGRLEQRISMPAVRHGLERIDIRDRYDVLDLFLIGSEDLRRYLGDQPVNSDERPILEFSLPKLLYMDPLVGVKNVEELLLAVEDVVPPVEVDAGEREAFYMGLGRTYSRSNFRLKQALKVFKLAAEENPKNAEALEQIKSINRELNPGG